MTLRVLATAAVVAALAAPAWGQAPPPDYKAAAEHYKSAEAAMARGDFPAAALEYGIAFDITKDPILFFKIGQANEKAGKCPVALTYYTRYLREGNPSEEYQRLTEERIAVCSGARPAGGGDGTGTGGDGGAGPGDGGAGDGDGGAGDGGAGAGGGGDLGDDGAGLGTGLGTGDAGPSFTDQPGSWKRTTAWVATGFTVGFVAAGVVLAMSAEGTEQDMQALIDFRNAGRPVRFDEVRSQYVSLQEDGERFDRLATIAFAAAGATALTAVVLFIIDGPGDTRAPAVHEAKLRPTIDRHGGGVAVGWAF